MTNGVFCQETSGTRNKSCCFRLSECDKHVENEMVDRGQQRGVVKFRSSDDRGAYRHHFEILESSESEMSFGLNPFACSTSRTGHSHEMNRKTLVRTLDAEICCIYFAVRLNKSLTCSDKENVGAPIPAYSPPTSLANGGNTSRSE